MYITKPKVIKMQSIQCTLLVYSLHYSVDHQCEHSSSYLETKPSQPPSNIENQTWFSFTGNTLKWAKLLYMAYDVYCVQSTIGFLANYVILMDLWGPVSDLYTAFTDIKNKLLSSYLCNKFFQCPLKFSYRSSCLILLLPLNFKSFWGIYTQSQLLDVCNQ